MAATKTFTTPKTIAISTPRSDDDFLYKTLMASVPTASRKEFEREYMPDWSKGATASAETTTSVASKESVMEDLKRMSDLVMSERMKTAEPTMRDLAEAAKKRAAAGSAWDRARILDDAYDPYGHLTSTGRHRRMMEDQLRDAQMRDMGVKFSRPPEPEKDRGEQWGSW